MTEPYWMRRTLRERVRWVLYAPLRFALRRGWIIVADVAYEASWRDARVSRANE